MKFLYIMFPPYLNSTRNSGQLRYGERSVNGTEGSAGHINAMCGSLAMQRAVRAVITKGQQLHTT